MASFSITTRVDNGAIEFSGSISRHDLNRLRLSPSEVAFLGTRPEASFERATDLSGSFAAETLLKLEVIYRHLTVANLGDD